MRILLVHDDDATLLAVRRALRPSHFSWHVTMVTSARAARAELARRTYDVIVVDESSEQASDGDGVSDGDGDGNNNGDGDGDDNGNDKDARTPRIPLLGAVDLVERIAALEDNLRSTSHPSSLSDALARAVITHAAVMENV